MKAVMLAAGSGTRLLPHTQDRPKCLVKLFGKPLLEHQLEALGNAGVEDFVIVTGYRSEQLQSYPGRKYYNADFLTTNMVHSLFCAESEFDDDLLLAYTDIVYHPSLIQTLIRSTEEINILIDLDWKRLWALRLEDPLCDAETLKLDSEGFVLELGKKPRTENEIEGQYMGLLFIRRDSLRLIRSIYHAMSRDLTYDGKAFPQMFMTSFIQVWIDRGLKVKAVPVRSGWLEVDTAKDLALYESGLASELWTP